SCKLLLWGAGVGVFPRASNLALSRTTGVRIVKRARGVAFDARIRWVEPHRRPAKTLARSAKPVPAGRWLAARADGGRMPRRARLPASPALSPRDARAAPGRARARAHSLRAGSTRRRASSPATPARAPPRHRVRG